MKSRFSWLIFILVIVVLAAMAWVADFITLQGERTVYTAVCQGGNWQGSSCTGKLIAGERFRFRVLKSHREVVFWTAGVTTEPSGKFDDCTIQDGRNWRCNANADFPRTITREMVHGSPIPDLTGTALSFHKVPKWRWHLLMLGVPTGNEVSELKG